MGAPMWDPVFWAINERWTTVDQIHTIVDKKREELLAQIPDQRRAFMDEKDPTRKAALEKKYKATWKIWRQCEEIIAAGEKEQRRLEDLMEVRQLELHRGWDKEALIRARKDPYAAKIPTKIRIPQPFRPQLPK